MLRQNANTPPASDNSSWPLTRCVLWRRFDVWRGASAEISSLGKKRSHVLNMGEFNAGFFAVIPIGGV